VQSYAGQKKEGQKGLSPSYTCKICNDTTKEKEYEISVFFYHSTNYIESFIILQKNFSKNIWIKKKVVPLQAVLYD
jgi:hypothetical protein